MSYPTEVKVVGLSFRRVTEKLERGDKVKLIPEPDNKYDPNALAIYTTGGQHIGYVGKKDPLRMKMLDAASKGEVLLPVLTVNYHEDGTDKLWDSVESGDMTQLWLRAFSKTPLEDNTFAEIESFTGEKVLWSEFLHICTDLKGSELMGGSTYAKKFEKEFDRERIARAYAKKNELDVNSVLEYWDNLGKVSMDYGTSIHTALEHYSKSAKVFGHEGAMPRQKHLKQAVEAFLRVSDFDRCIAEPLITDVEKGMSGWIDNLRFLDDKRVVVEDYKTNTFNSEEDYQKKWPVKLRAYQHQFNYYGTILDNHGYVVTGTVAWHWHEGKWNKHANPFTPVKEYLRENHDS